MQLQQRPRSEGGAPKAKAANALSVAKQPQPQKPLSPQRRREGSALVAKATTASFVRVANEQVQQVKPQEQPQEMQKSQTRSPSLRRRHEEEQHEEQPAVKRHGGSKLSGEDVANEVVVGVRVRRKYHGHGTYNGTATAVVDGQVAVEFEHKMDGIDFWTFAEAAQAVALFKKDAAVCKVRHMELYGYITARSIELRRLPRL